MVAIRDQLSSPASKSARPPTPPWMPLWPNEPATGYLSMYLADDLSRLPVRHITRPNDNKSDPNIETGTYGLFSTCERQMRAGIVKNGAQYVIFMCRWGQGRAVTGYYRLAWKAPGTLHVRQVDYALAAEVMHFVDQPIPIVELPEPLSSVVGKKFRLSKRIDSSHTEQLVSILSEQPNALPDYLEEVDRLERFQLSHSGFRYPSWQQEEPFNWEMAERYLEPSFGVTVVKNQTVEGVWLCSNPDCVSVVRNQSLLKRCPACGTMGTLQTLSDKG